MGIIEDFKNIDDWQTVTVIVVFLLICFGTIVIGAFLIIPVLYTGGLVALGIPTSFLANLGRSRLSNSPKTTKQVKKVQEAEVEQMRKIVADLTCQFANLKSQFEMVKINKELEKIE